MSEDLRIQGTSPVIYSGHNNHTAYRYMGMLSSILMGWEVIKFNTFLFVRYKYPNMGKSKIVPFRDIKTNTRLLSLVAVPIYILFDIVNRNYRLNSGKSFIYKLGYSADLLLFHSIATYAVPFAMAPMLAFNITRVLSHFTRTKMILMYSSMFFFFYFGAYFVKGIDISTDVILDYSYRRYIHDYRHTQKKKTTPVAEIQPEIELPVAAELNILSI